MLAAYELVAPHATLIAKSTPIPGVIQAIYGSREGGAHRHRHFDTHTPAPTMELAGRVCYAAYGCKSAKTDSHEGYLQNILRQNHGSVLEHSSYTFLLSGISRADSHEIVRHRHFSFSQESQRYVMQNEPFRISVHPAMIDSSESLMPLYEFGETVTEDFIKARAFYDGLREDGYGHKQASEAARQFIPNAAAVEMVVTGNVRSWLEFISKRDHPAADASIQDIARQVYEILKLELPEIFSEEAREIWDTNAEQEAPKTSA